MVAASLLSMLVLIVLLTFFMDAQSKLPGMLYPRESESRTLKRLDGMWNFRVDDSPTRNQSFVDKWFSTSLENVCQIGLIMISYAIFKICTVH